MKAFYKGFINGIRCCTIICAIITGAMGAMYGLIKGLEYLIETHGAVMTTICCIVAFIILFGIFEGLWRRYHYNKLAKHLARIEANKNNMPQYVYESEVNRIKGAMEAILKNGYSMIVR